MIAANASVVISALVSRPPVTAIAQAGPGWNSARASTLVSSHSPFHVSVPVPAGVEAAAWPW